MATISISQLDTATQAKVDDLYEVAVVDENSQTGYASRNVTAAQIATLFAQGIQFSGLSTEAKNIIAAINEAAQNGGTEVEANPAGEPTDTLQKIGIDGTIYEVGGSEPVSKTVTGNPIHIEDAADAPIVSGTVAFDPKQDLHGFSKPWVGGAGKNKLPLTVDGIKALNAAVSWSDNRYTVNGVTFTILTDSDNNVIGIKLNGTNTLGSILTFTLASSDFGDSDFRSDGSAVSSTYKILSGRNDDSANWMRIQYQSSNKSIYVRIADNAAFSNDVITPMILLATETDPTFEPYSNECPIEGYTDCALEVTDDATSPTVTNTYTIDLDGTRYGGKVNPVSGVMRVDRACFIGDGSSDENWNITGTGRLQLSDISNLKQYTDITNEYLTCSIAVKATSTANTGVITYSSGKLVLYLEGFKDGTLEDWKTYISSNPVYICYELATPFTVQLTPEQIRTLQGTNNISTNMTSMSLEYITQDYQPLVKLIEQSVGHHYSEQERVVGTWFGKPLYEKSWDVSIEIPSASANTWLSTGILTASVNCDTVVGGKLVDNSNQFILGNIGFIQQNTYFAINVPIGNRTITTVTIQFTKTTD